MLIGISIFELHLSQARSLKEKRKVVRSLIDRIHHRFRVSIAETDHHDLHQRTEITIAAVVLDDAEGQRMMDAVREQVDSQPGALLLAWDPQWLEGEQ
jgi:uncharacterized protein YlxP (DUF503 family)